MNIEDLVSADCVVYRTDITSKKRALDVIAELLAKHTQANDTLAVFQLLTEREKLGSTSLGHGVALPHSRSSLCTQAIGAFIKLEKGIDFDSPERESTDLLFALLVPEHYTDEHLKILATLAGLFSDKNFCQHLRASTSSAELYKRLTTWQVTSRAS
jgi:PTS system nitrogen regulatory IIA component